MSYASSCPTSDRLLLLLEDDQQERIANDLVEHLSRCRTCQDALEAAAVGRTSWLTGALACGLAADEQPPELQRAISELKITSAASGTTWPAHGPSQSPLDFLSATDHPGAIGAVGPYPILQVVGQGGMGIVLKARDLALERIVALKVLAPQLAANGTARQRFSREARAAAAVAHEHVVGIHAVAEANGLPYLVMEYIAGVSLQQKIDRTGPLEPADAIRIALQIAEGLAAAHAQGLVHRDIKPANILLENGVERVRITDFGLARAVDDAGCTQHGTLAGTPEYMSPEQAAGQAVDARADLFSLGCVVYACCTGHSPFRASSSLGALHQVTNADPKPMRLLNVSVPLPLEAIVRRLLAKSPSDRLQSAAEAADALRKLLADMQVPGAASRWKLESKAAAAIGWMNSAKNHGPAVVALVCVLGLALAASRGLFVSPPLKDDKSVAGSASDNDQAARFDAAGSFPGPVPGPPAVPPDAPRPAELLTLDGHTATVRGLAVDTEHKLAVSCTGWPATDGTLRIWSLDTGREVHQISAVPEGSLTMDALALVPKTNRVLVGLSDGSVRGFDLSTREKVLHVQAHAQGVNDLDVSQDGVLFASAGDDGSIGIWRADSGGPMHQITGAHTSSCRAMAFAPDGESVASGGLDGAIRLWDVKTGELKRDFPIKHGQVWAVAFADNGRTVIAGGNGAAAYDVASGEFRWCLYGHTYSKDVIVTDVAISKDQSKLATCSNDGTFCVWNLAQKNAIFRGDAGVGSLWQVPFSPDGRQLLTAGGGTFKEGKYVFGDRFSIRVWSLDQPPPDD